jgi:hypothetical protein
MLEMSWCLIEPDHNTCRLVAFGWIGNVNSRL